MQNHLIFQTICNTFTNSAGLGSKLRWTNNSKIAVEFNESCLKQDKATFNPKNVVNLFIVYKLDLWSRYLNIKFTLGDYYLFGAVKLTKNVDRDKYGYSGYNIGFDAYSKFSLRTGEWGKSIIIFGIDNNLSLHADNRKRDIPLLGERPADRSNDKQ